MIEVSNADRVVFPDIGKTKGDVVSYYERIAPRALPHVAGRPLSIRRFPKGLAAPGFFQKNVPPHYPSSIDRYEVPRSAAAAKAHPRKGATDPGVTVYPIVGEEEHLPYLANQGAIELHVPSGRLPDLYKPDRIVIDLDPPKGAVALVQRAARIVRDALGELGLETVPVATGSKGYHVVAPIRVDLDFEAIGVAVHKFATLLAAKHPDELTIVFRIAKRGERVFLDFLRNWPNATMIAPYSLRASARATVATPVVWSELDATPPDTFSIADLDRLIDRADPLAALNAKANDAQPFVAAVDDAFAAAGLELETFDRFRS
jgi:bifunctional non-homologous end joining protein LigD